MFGKSTKVRSPNDKFIMDAGKKAGNLRSPPPAQKTMKAKVQPVAAAKMTVSARQKMGAMGKLKAEL